MQQTSLPRTGLCTLAGLFTLASPSFAAGELNALDTIHFADAAKRDAYCVVHDYDHALSIDGLAPDLAFTPNGVFVERADGSATLSGTLTRTSEPDHRYLIWLTFSDSRTGGAAPVTELDPTAYVDGGGSVDPETWRFYDSIEGRLVGLGDMAGAEIELTRGEHALQVGAGANNMSLALGAFATLEGSTKTQPNGVSLPLSLDLDLRLDLRGEVGRCARSADGDPATAQWPTQHAFLLLGGVGEDFVFHPPGQLIESDDGSARMFGWIERLSDPSARFYVDLRFADRVDPGAPMYPPAGSPKKELLPQAYASNGGEVDPDSWHYYLSLEGSLIGADSLSGVEIDVERYGPAAQAGYGASGKNTGYGISSWLTLHTVAQPTGQNFPDEFIGDLNSDLDDECEAWISEAEANEASLYSGGFAFTLFGVGYDFVAVQPGEFVEFADGTARLEATVARKSDPDAIFHVTLELDDRVDPIDPAFPPEGSPKLELKSGAYASNGGPIDPDKWHYYERLEAEFVGLGSYDGALLTGVRLGPAFQIGLGASGKNFEFGASSWIDITTVNNPTAGPAFPPSFQGDCNCDFTAECPPLDAATAGYGQGSVGTDGFVPRLRLLGVPAPGQPIILRLDRALGGAPAMVAFSGAPNGEVLPTGSIYLLSNTTLVLGPWTTAGVAPGEGVRDVKLTMPATVVSGAIYGQALVADPTANGGVALSNGVGCELK